MICSRRGVVPVVLIGFLVTMFPLQMIAAAEKTVYGTVGDLRQVLGEDGKKYIIEWNELGDELAEQKGKRVKVTGDLEERYGGARVITVTSYEVIE